MSATNLNQHQIIINLTANTTTHIKCWLNISKRSPLSFNRAPPPPISNQCPYQKNMRHPPHPALKSSTNMCQWARHQFNPCRTWILSTPPLPPPLSTAQRVTWQHQHRRTMPTHLSIENQLCHRLHCRIVRYVFMIFITRSHYLILVSSVSDLSKQSVCRSRRFWRDILLRRRPGKTGVHADVNAWRGQAHRCARFQAGDVGLLPDVAHEPQSSRHRLVRRSSTTILLRTQRGRRGCWRRRKCREWSTWWRRLAWRPGAVHGPVRDDWVERGNVYIGALGAPISEWPNEHGPARQFNDGTLLWSWWVLFLLSKWTAS